PAQADGEDLRRAALPGAPHAGDRGPGRGRDGAEAVAVIVGDGAGRGPDPHVARPAAPERVEVAAEPRLLVRERTPVEAQQRPLIADDPGPGEAVQVALAAAAQGGEAVAAPAQGRPHRSHDEGVPGRPGIALAAEPADPVERA